MLSELGFIDLDVTPVSLPLNVQSSVSENISFAGNEISIIEAGIYRVQVSVIGDTIVGNMVSTNLTINSLPQLLVSQSLDSNYSFSFTDYYTLSAGDLLGIEMSSSSPVTFMLAPFGITASLLVERVG